MNVKGTLAVIAGFLIHLTLGTFFTIGNMTPYLISYLRKEAEPNATYSLSIWVNALSYAGQGSLMALGGVMEKRLGGRLTCIIGCVLFCGSIASTSMTIKLNFWAMAVTYGLLSCFGLGVAYIAPLSIGMRWFPKNKGLVNGIILSGYGLGALIFNPVQTALMNPRNLSPSSNGYFTDNEILRKVPNTLIYLGVIYGCIQVFGILLLFQPPRPKKIKDKADQMQTYGQTFIRDDFFLSIVGSAGSACNALGRICWGRVQDKYTYKMAMLIISVSLTIIMFTFILVPYGSKAMFTIWVMAAYLSFGGIFPKTTNSPKE